MFWSIILPVGFFVLYAVATLTLTICRILAVPKCKRCGKKTTPPALDADIYPCWACGVAYDIITVDGKSVWRELTITK